MTPEQAQASIEKLLASWEEGDGGPAAWSWMQEEVRRLSKFL